MIDWEAINRVSAARDARNRRTAAALRSLAVSEDADEVVEESGPDGLRGPLAAPQPMGGMEHQASTLRPAQARTTPQNRPMGRRAIFHEAADRQRMPGALVTQPPRAKPPAF